MPKDKASNSVSVDRARASPYPCRSKSSVEGKFKSVMENDDDVKQQWEVARCPICLEHPHSAVLLRCSSYNKGCRPYICNTSNRHSDCLAQFRKSFVDSSAQGQPESSTHSKKEQLTCPLCRGQVDGWIVDMPARQFMNAKPRSCPFEECDCSGTYVELRNHIRREHPLTKPSEVDPARQREWVRMEREREFKDVLSVVLSEIGENLTPALYENLVNGFLMVMFQRNS